MKKKLILAFILIITLMLSITLNVSADFGPKPSTQITFENVQKDFYVTLLSKKRVIGYRHLEIDDPYYEEYVSELSDMEKKFFFYEEKDGYQFYGDYKKITKDSNVYKWGYHAPEEFKILIYYEDTDTFVLYDNVIERYAFASYFTVKLDDNGNVSFIRKTYNYVGETLKCILRIILTILIEIFVAFLFKYKGKVLALIVILNVITQILLNVSLNVIYYFDGSLSVFIYFFIFEFIIFILESIIYAIAFKIINRENKVFVSIMYAICANFASLFLGFLLLRIMV